VSSEIVELIAGGGASTRAELAQALGLAPSTVSLQVSQLLAAGVLVEGAFAPSRGGRPGRTLKVRDSGSCVVVADLGSSHGRIGVVSLTGEVLGVQEIELDVADGPDATLDCLVDEWSQAAEGRAIAAAGLALGGPVDPERRCVVQASRMPDWNDVLVGDKLQRMLAVPIVVENDADAMALGEHLARGDSAVDSVTVKAGSAIGSGLVVEGRIYHGWSAGAGNITHTRVAAPSAAPCSCGNSGCLETVASGAGIARLLRERGIQVESTSEAVRLANHGDPDAMSLVRAAGGHLGAVLCTVVNFVNPGAVYLAGVLSMVEPFVAAVRSQIYEGAHPLATGQLRIEKARHGGDSAIVGIARLAVAAAHEQLARA